MWLIIEFKWHIGMLSLPFSFLVWFTENPQIESSWTLRDGRKKIFELFSLPNNIPYSISISHLFFLLDRFLFRFSISVSISFDWNTTQLWSLLQHTEPDLIRIFFFTCCNLKSPKSSNDIGDNKFTKLSFLSWKNNYNSNNRQQWNNSVSN